MKVERLGAAGDEILSYRTGYIQSKGPYRV